MRTALLRMSALAGALAAAQGCGGGEVDSPYRSAVLITLDTTRADALSCYGGRSGLTPNLDRLASQGVLFERARTVAPLTLPAHCSMLTGLYPPRHGVRDNNAASLSDEASTIAERAREAGFETAGFVAAAVLGRAFGVHQGFETWIEPDSPEISRSSHYAELPAGEILGHVRTWLSRRDSSKPFFLWVHFFEPHDPYAPGPAFLSRAGGDAYLGEVARVDAAVGTLLEALSQDPAWDSTAVLVVADHGEGLGQHDESTHSAYVWDTTLHVPMILRLPDLGRAGTRAPEIASVVDVHPTLIELMGLGPAGDVDGTSLAARAPAERGVYFESFHGYLNYNWAPLSGWVDEGGKYIHAPTPLWLQPDRDPGETTPDRGTGSRTEPYREAISRLFARPTLAHSGGEVSEADIEKLRSLGYAAVGGASRSVPHPLEETQLPDPHERAQEWNRLYDAVELVSSGKGAEALPILEGVLSQNPGNPFALEYYAAAFASQRRYSEAILALRRLIATGRGSARSHYNLAVGLETLGERREAIENYRRAVELDPAYVAPLRKLALLLREEDPAQARRYRRQLEALE